MRPRLRSALLAITTVVMLLGTAVVAWVAAPAVRARYLLHEFLTIRLGASTYKDAWAFARKVHATPTPFAPCTPASCEWEVRFTNHAVPAWWRGPGVGFVISYNVHNGIVDRKNTGYGVGPLAGEFYGSQVFLEEQRDWGGGNKQVPVQVTQRSSDRNPLFSFDVRMTPQASAEDRHRYTALNLSCFWRFHGCKDYRDLLPAASRPPDMLVDSR